MARMKKDKIESEDITGLQYFDKLAPLLEPVHDVIVIAGRCPRRDQRIEFVVVVVPRVYGGESLVGCPFDVAHRAGHARELGVVCDREHGPTILAGAAVTALRGRPEAAVVADLPGQLGFAEELQGATCRRRFPPQKGRPICWWFRRALPGFLQSQSS